MIRSHDGHNVDDVTAYIASLDEHEQAELAVAGAAIEVAIMLERGRNAHTATLPARIQQREHSRVESATEHSRIDGIGVYLAALGYDPMAAEIIEDPIDLGST